MPRSELHPWTMDIKTKLKLIRRAALTVAIVSGSVVIYTSWQIIVRLAQP